MIELFGFAIAGERARQKLQKLAKNCLILQPQRLAKLAEPASEHRGTEVIGTQHSRIADMGAEVEAQSKSELGLKRDFYPIG